MKPIAVQVGSVTVGGDAPISIQTMWKRPLSKVDEALIAEVNRLQALGCDILRFAVPDLETADRLGELAGRVSIPLVADIHFDYRLALRCLDHPIAKIRINPGNIGARWKVEEVVQKAKDKGVPIRIGVKPRFSAPKIPGASGSRRSSIGCCRGRNRDPGKPILPHHHRFHEILRY